LKLSGQLITFEGLDGCGKSTQLARLAECLRDQGYSLTETREPGGTPVGQEIRDILLHVSPDTITPLAELTLMFAARAQHIEQVILPALRRGELVLCDRFTDSSIAYQGYGRGVALETIRTLEKELCQGVSPAVTLLLDVSVAVSQERTEARNREMGLPQTRFEKEGAEFFERVRQGYLEVAQDDPQRVRLLDGSLSVEKVRAAINRSLENFLRSAAAKGLLRAESAHGI
jgi:dTMP kinase